MKTKENPSAWRWFVEGIPYGAFSLVALSGIVVSFFYAGRFVWNGFWNGNWNDTHVIWLCYALAVTILLYVPRMLFITGYAHRGLSHRSYRAGRKMLFWMGLCHSSTVQRSPLKWAAHHRSHHNHSDTEDDVHSPITSSIAYSHFFWIFDPRHGETQFDLVQDLIKECPELLWFEHRLVLYIVPVLLLACVCWIGSLLGVPLLYSGIMAISATFIFHQAVYCINSLTHLVGKRRFNTPDHSRNNLFAAFITFGEGWHNNHHRKKKNFYSFETRAESRLDLTWRFLNINDSLGMIQPYENQKKAAAGIIRLGTYEAYAEEEVMLAITRGVAKPLPAEEVAS